MIEFHAIFLKAIAGDQVRIATNNYNAAYNLRQKFYRYRDQIRASDSELVLLVDDLLFEIDNDVLVISYNNPENVLEALSNDDTRPGDESLKSQQPDQSAPQERHSSEGD